MKLCTCRTEDIGDGTPCPNNGLGFLWDDQAAQQAAEEAGAIFNPSIVCGPCGKPIPDITDATDHPGDPNTFVPPDDESTG